MLDLKSESLDNFKAVLFDLDGTLVNSEHLHALSIEKILKEDIVPNLQNFQNNNQLTKKIVEAFHKPQILLGKC